MENNYLVGTKIFKENDDGSISILRIKYALKNGTTIATDQNNKSIEITSKTIEEDFTVLKPDALMSFIIGKTGDLEDVLILVYRRKEMDEKSMLPYCVCRQNITDFFSMALTENDNLAGISLTVDTLPEGVAMENVLACDEVIKQINLAVYNTDTLNSILSMIKSKDMKDYDNALYNLFLKHIHVLEKREDSVHVDRSLNHIDGYCKSLKILLSYNDFMYDVLTGFNIYPINIDLKDSIEKPIPSEYLQFFEALVNANIDKSIIIKYDHDVDLDEITYKYIMVSDCNEDVYIISYTTYGKYHIPLENVESEENIENLMSIIHPSSTMSSLLETYMRINKNKYQ